jgi:hypothetical protein
MWTKDNGKGWRPASTEINPALTTAAPKAADIIEGVIKNAQTDGNKNIKQPVIIVIQSSSNDNESRKKGGGGVFGRNKHEHYRHQGYGLFTNLFHIVYTVKSIMRIILIGGVIIGVIILISNPQILDNFITNVLKKAGLYNLIQYIRKLIGN